ncbi:MAG: hypothetical protein ACE5FS_05910 [Paracoccaceae bacterium]
MESLPINEQVRRERIRTFPFSAGVFGCIGWPGVGIVFPKVALQHLAKGK